MAHLPAQGIKLVCNELIHVRQLPYKPDQTYFRGDRTRPLQIEKVDVVEEEGPDQGKVTSVTNIWTVDATLFDSGVGMDATNVVAHGPGRLEIRPDRDQPVERIAIWQDRLIVQNKLGPTNEVVHKIIDLVGNRPCFIDNLQKTSLDSGSWIQVWLKPKPRRATAPGPPRPPATVGAQSERSSRTHRSPRPAPSELISWPSMADASSGEQRARPPEQVAAACKSRNCMRLSMFTCSRRPRR